jgi:YggT family protein
VLLHLLGWLAQIYVFVLLLRAVLSWFPTRPDSGLERLIRALDVVTEPVLRPIRRVLPPIRAGGMGIDLSVLVALIVFQIVGSILRSA